MRCCSAWKLPIGTPNCRRVFRYSSVASLAELDRAHRLRAEQRGGVVDDVLDQRQRAALVAQQRVAPAPHPGEPHVGGAQLVDACGTPCSVTPGRAAVDEEQADARRVGVAAARARGHDQRVGGGRRAAPTRFSPSSVKPSPHRFAARAHVRQVVARVALGVREGQPQLALDRARAGCASAAPPTRRARRAAAPSPTVAAVGLDDQRLAERLHHQHHVDRAAAEAAVLLGERQAEQAHLGEALPTPSRCSPSAEATILRARVEVVVLAREALDRRRRAAAVLRCSRSSCALLYSPSVTLAMMLRWISLEPA